MPHGGEIGVHHKVVEWAGMTFHWDTLLMTWLAMAIVLIIGFLATRGLSMVPRNKWQNALEIVYEFLNGSVKENLGNLAHRYIGLIYTLFLFLVVSNMLGLIPRLTSPTNDLNTTLGLALFVLIVIHGSGVRYRGAGGYIKHAFFEHGIIMTPISIIEEIAKPLTLSFRLFGNILAGEILLMVLLLLVPWIVPSAWLAFSVFVGFVQAYLFSMLTLAYISLAVK